MDSEEKLKKLEKEVQTLKTHIRQSKQTIEYPKTFFNKLLFFILLGSLMTILLFLSNMVEKKFSFTHSVGFFIASIIIFRIVAAEWKKNLLLPAHIFFSSAVLSFSAYIFFINPVHYGLDGFLFLPLVIIASYALIFWIDESYKIFKLNFGGKKVNKVFVTITILLLSVGVILYTSISDVIILLDTHPWLATVVMVGISVTTTYILTKRNKRGN